jgi:hypothetical protein
MKPVVTEQAGLAGTKHYFRDGRWWSRYMQKRRRQGLRRQLRERGE